MQAQDAMTKEVITVAPQTLVGELARLLVQHRVNAIPVVADDGRLVGIVSQTDLGHRSETGTEKRRKWWLDLFADTDAGARQYLKTHGLKVEDIMTRISFFRGA
ncbi:MAG: CBS domain-containing protein [Rhodospirillales bacterium]|nr:CBS domain-containing protein [Rhodospirillales bacterium]